MKVPWPTLALLAALPLRAEEWASSLQGIDIYGTDRVTAGQVQERFGKKIDGFALSMDKRVKGKSKAADQARARVEAEIRALWGFPFVQLAWMESYADGKHRSFVTVDIVEAKDVKARMAFRPPPTRTVSDPGGLLAAWDEYGDLGLRLFRQGLIETSRGDCPAFYCRWSNEPPDLKSYERRFQTDVPPRKEELARLLAQDRDPARRAKAVFLLSYIGDGNALSTLLADALRDPETAVRSAALDVFSDIAVYHKNVFIPLEKLEAVLDFPTVEDRSKALAVMAGLASHPDYRAFLVNKAGPQICRLLRQGQPTVHDTAYAALGILSKENFDGRDYAAWETWIEKNRVVGGDSAPAGPR